MQLDRRTFIEAVAASAFHITPGGTTGLSAQASSATGPLAWRREFPALARQVNGHGLAYLDSAATTQRPRAVIDAISGFYEGDNANPGATLHSLARLAAGRYSAARATVARFLNAATPSEVIFTKGTTEAINLVASTWAAANVGRGDDIVLTVAEHYSNLLPWRALADRVGATVKTVDVDDDGRLLASRVQAALTRRTRLIAFSHVSNVLGLINPAQEICEIAQARGVATLVDAAQSAPHVALDVQALGCDFLACSGHKLLGPMGVGVLWARQSILDAMPPYQLGSNMAHEVDATSAQYEHGALKYQAGTPNVSGAIGLAAAIDALHRYGMTAIARHDTDLVEHARTGLATVRGLRVFGTLADSQARVPVFTFTMQGVPVSRLVQSLDAQGVAVRGGDMAALPLLKRFGVGEAVRASCYLYTTRDEIDRLVDVLRSEAKRR